MFVQEMHRSVFFWVKSLHQGDELLITIILSLAKWIICGKWGRDTALDTWLQ